MAIDAIGTVAESSDLLLNTGIGQEDFLRILLAQLRFQDPLKPVDNQQFVTQLAQFSALELSRQQSERIDQLADIQATDQSIALLGRTVEIGAATGGSTVGKVTAISITSGEPRLTIDANGTTFVDLRPSDVVLIR